MQIESGDAGKISGLANKSGNVRSNCRQHAFQRVVVRLCNQQCSQAQVTFTDDALDNQSSFCDE